MPSLGFHDSLRLYGFCGRRVPPVPSLMHPSHSNRNAGASVRTPRGPVRQSVSLPVPFLETGPRPRQSAPVAVQFVSPSRCLCRFSRRGRGRSPDRTVTAGCSHFCRRVILCLVVGPPRPGIAWQQRRAAGASPRRRRRRNPGHGQGYLATEAFRDLTPHSATRCFARRDTADI